MSWSCPKCGSPAWGSSQGRRYCHALTGTRVGGCGYSEPMSNRAGALRRLQAVYARLVLGDPVLARKVAECKRLAKAGDPQAKVIYNSLAVLHWNRRDRLAFARAEVFYNRLRAYDKQAHAELRRLVSRKNAGDRQAQALFSTLKAVHHKRKASLWTTGPGSPTTGYHPMPIQHRVGIEIPGLGNVPIPNFNPQPQPQMFLPLTPQALTMLIQLFQQVLAMSGGQQTLFRSVAPMDDVPMASSMPQGGLGPLATSVVRPSVVTTTPKPAIMSTVPQARLSTTVQSSALKSAIMTPLGAIRR